MRVTSVVDRNVREVCVDVLHHTRGRPSVTSALKLILVNASVSYWVWPFCGTNLECGWNVTNCELGSI